MKENLSFLCTVFLVYKENKMKGRQKEEMEGGREKLLIIWIITVYLFHDEFILSTT